jgi:hypothetical protein
MMIEAITTSVTTVWLLTAAMVLLLFIAAAKDSFAAAFWFTVIGLALLQFVTIADPLSWVKAHPYAIGIGAAAYLPIGVGWSLFRWWKILQKAAVEIRKEKGNWSPSNYWSSWDSYVKYHLPSASANKERIVCWITYWPFSAAAYLLIDLLYDIGDWIYTKLSGFYQSMVDRVAASLSGDE